MIESKPYILINSIQHYDWGTKNGDAFIPKLIGIEVEPNKPYAELWIGAHSKAPSSLTLDGQVWKLDELINSYPNEILGERVADKFNNKLPFLLKVLSTEKALSIQAHPNKKLAADLHKKDPINYPDENHKPEIAIAIDTLDAIVGFKSSVEINKVVQKYSSLQSYVEKIQLNSAHQSEIDIPQFYSSILKLDGEELKELVEGIREQILRSDSTTKPERIFLKQYENFGVDPGLISILLFNLVELKKDEAIFTGSGVPHAYLKGNIIECMANSDNVVRAGLTPKYKDVRTLLDMIDYENKNMALIQPSNDNEIQYEVPVEEFELRSIKLEQNESKKLNDQGLIVGLLLNGSININYDKVSEKFERGEAFLIPFILERCEIISQQSSHLILVTIP